MLVDKIFLFTTKKFSQNHLIHNKNKYMKKLSILSKILLISILLISTSCSNKIGKFTVISTQNVKAIENKGGNSDETQATKIQSCTHRIYVTRTFLGVITLGLAAFFPGTDIVLGVSENARLETAVDNLIKEGKRKVPNADMIQNAEIQEKNIIIPLLYGYKCIILEGNLISSVGKKS